MQPYLSIIVAIVGLTISLLSSKNLLLYSPFWTLRSRHFDSPAKMAVPFLGIVGPFIPDYSTLFPLVASRRTDGNRHSYGNQKHSNGQLLCIGEAPIDESDTILPPFLAILNRLLQNSAKTREKHDQNLETFITNVGILHEVAFSPKCPILGTGHHFVVFAAPFDAGYHSFIPVDGRTINPEIYCLKTPNFTSTGAADSPLSKGAFRTEYYNTALQEIRVLLHPRIRRCENIINLFGLDFQEDYDDHTVAWPVLVMEYAEYGTLATLQEDIKIESELARILLLDVALGLNTLHECNIIHGDVKCENVLICRHAKRRYIAKLADFGHSVINPDTNSKGHILPGGTIPWNAPEFGNPLSVEGLKQTDVYSFGLMSWRVLVNKPSPFHLIPPAALGVGTIGIVNQFATLAKSRHGFQELVLQTMDPSGRDGYSRQVIGATLNKDPKKRNLSMAIATLSRGQGTLLDG
jgi:hypothetical protein